MTINDILNLYNTVNEKLYTASVAEAFFLIRKMIKEINDWGMSVEMDEYSSTYQQMLSYKLLTPQQIGTSQSTIYNQLIFNLFMLTMRAKDAFLLRHSNRRAAIVGDQSQLLLQRYSNGVRQDYAYVAVPT